MDITVNKTTFRFHWGFPLFLLFIIFSFYLWHSHSNLYWNNQWKKHRWASDYCKDRGYDIRNCTIQFKLPDQLSRETAYFDYCFEHGELRRIK